MKLVRADGHQQQQWALANDHTRTIARILCEHIGDNALVRSATQILKLLNGEAYENLDQKLQELGALYTLDPSDEFAVPPTYIVELMQAIHELYCQPLCRRLYRQQKEQIDSLRGAVVERLGLELIQHRYADTEECANSRRFLDQRNVTITLQEVDVAAISPERFQLEGYECKMKAYACADHDCRDLEYLYNAANEEGYRVQVGVISLDLSKYIEKRLEQLDAARCIRAFGVDALNKLQYSPFE